MTSSRTENLTPQGIGDSPWSFRQGKLWKAEADAVWQSQWCVAYGPFFFKTLLIVLWWLKQGRNRKGHQGLGWITSQHEGLEPALSQQVSVLQDIAIANPCRAPIPVLRFLRLPSILLPSYRTIPRRREVGERRQIIVPSNLGYGNRGIGPIPPGSTLPGIDTSWRYVLPAMALMSRLCIYCWNAHSNPFKIHSKHFQWTRICRIHLASKALFRCWAEIDCYTMKSDETRVRPAFVQMCHYGHSAAGLSSQNELNRRWLRRCALQKWRWFFEDKILMVSKLLAVCIILILEQFSSFFRQVARSIHRVRWRVCANMVHGCPRLVMQWKKQHLSGQLLGSRWSKHEGVNFLKADWTWMNPFSKQLNQLNFCRSGGGILPETKKIMTSVIRLPNFQHLPTKPASCSHGGAARATMEAGGACPGVLGIVCCQCVLLLVLSWLKPVGFSGLSPGSLILPCTGLARTISTSHHDWLSLAHLDSYPRQPTFGQHDIWIMRRSCWVWQRSQDPLDSVWWCYLADCTKASHISSLLMCVLLSFVLAVPTIPKSRKPFMQVQTFAWILCEHH